MLWMCKALFSTGKSIVMDIFVVVVVVVANGIFALSMKGVYVIALVKKHWYCPKIVPEDLIDRNFSTSRWGVQTCWRLLLKTERHSVSYASKS